MAATNGITLRKNITYLLQYLIKEKKFLNIVIDILKKSNCALFFFSIVCTIERCYLLHCRCKVFECQTSVIHSSEKGRVWVSLSCYEWTFSGFMIPGNYKKILTSQSLSVESHVSGRVANISPNKAPLYMCILSCCNFIRVHVHMRVAGNGILKLGI